MEVEGFLYDALSPLSPSTASAAASPSGHPHPPHVDSDPYAAWKLWREGMSFNLMDPILKGSCGRNEVMRCIHIALLCVQDDPDVRPSMATVVLMLNSYSVTLGIPQQPASLSESKTRLHTVKSLESDQSTSKSMHWSVNEASITELDPR
ncbi:hypothetical protein RHSIM_Rhsim13G0161400 [Rhododendron simsii]|uniref:Uncharacterized protein n=1 Tax=Rhododendron simsii TaxID=118357 RepID=A0A834G0D7_RHOSS|nr:hypothetical protein RHSIM_Rhsim13G0161400 [Rhododendron simsii]